MYDSSYLFLQYLRGRLILSLRTAVTVTIQDFTEVATSTASSHSMILDITK